MIYFDDRWDLWVARTPKGDFGFDTKEEAEIFVKKYDEDIDACLKEYLG